ncbi:MAG: BrnT family toxin [Pseudomonadota bacterium]
MSEEFEWDFSKAQANEEKHGVTFTTATRAFLDTFGLDLVDDRHGDDEDRFTLIAFVDARLLVVSYTVRGERMRIISARLAEPLERRMYHEAFDDW